jgi:hypothetical protein
MADLIFIPPASPANAADDGGGPARPGVPSAGGMDPSLVSGQDPDSIAGIPVSYSTGAGAGTPAPGGQGMAGGDPSNQPNQYPSTEPISGVTLGGTGMPGTEGAPPDRVEDPGESFWISDPNYTSGKPGGGSGNQMIQVPVALGLDDSTTVAGQYPPAKPIVPGDFYPHDSGVTGGHVMVGGFKKGDRG